MNNSNVYIYLVSKHPMHWVASVTQRNPQDLFLKRPALLKNQKPDLNSLCRLYNTFYRTWLDLLSLRGRFAIVRYEELLSMPLTCIQRFSEVMGVDSPPSLQEAHSVPYSSKRSHNALISYLSGHHGLPDDFVTTIADSVDQELLERMGYAKNPPAFG